MASRVLRRLAATILLVWAVVTVAFFVNNVLPSNPARMVAGPQARPQDVERIRVQLGLDRPVIVQYARFLGRLLHVSSCERGTAEGPGDAHRDCATLGPLHLDLGRSYQQRRPVTEVLGERLPRTALLAVTAVVVQLLLGAGLGIVAATRRGRALDYGAVALSLLGVSAPTFLVGLGLQYLLAHKWRLLPLDGYGATVGEHLSGLVLPSLTLGIYGAAYYTRLVRDEMIGLLGQDFVRTARAKGASRAAVVVRHALRNALVPLATVVGLDLGALLGGAIVTETLFRWPGLGALSVTAILDRDGPLILGSVLVSALAVALASVLVDALYAVLDPRVER